MFDYKSFAESMKKQSSELIPAEFSKNEADFIKKIVYDFVIICGEYLNDEQEYNFTDEQKVFIAQLIAEWTFHKSVDLINSKIPQEYWEAILQKIAFTILEVVKQAIKKELPQDEILKIVEHHIIKCYKDCLDKLQLNDEQKKIALEQSSIDTLATSNPSDSIDKKSIIKNILHVLMLFAVGISSSIIAFAIFPHLPTLITCQGKLIPFCITVIFVSILYIATQKWQLEQKFKELENIREQFHNLINPDLYKHLGVDVISLQVGHSLLCIADPDQGGELLPKTTALRLALTEDIGYAVPLIRVIDSSKLEKEEYAIGVRNNIIDTGFVYPNKYMVIADNWKLTNKPVPQNAIIAKDPIHKTEAFWLDEEDVKDLPNISVTSADDVIIKHLEEVLVQQVDLILSEKEIKKYIQFAENSDAVSISELQKRLTKEDIRQVFVNLIRENVSIKDILLIFRLLLKFSNFSTKPSVLSERLRTELCRQICLQNVNKEKTLYALTLSSELEDLLYNTCQTTEYCRMFMLTQQQIQSLVNSTAKILLEAHKKINTQPVILCTPKIRLALYELLVKHLPSIVVLSYAELITDINVERVGTIEIEK